MALIFLVSNATALWIILLNKQDKLEAPCAVSLSYVFIVTCPLRTVMQMSCSIGVRNLGIGCPSLSGRLKFPRHVLGIPYRYDKEV